MKVYNLDKTQELTDYDLEKGYLETKSEKIEHEAQIVHHEAEIVHHPAVEEVKEQGHYEVVAEYPETGGKDLAYIVDVPYVAPQEAYDEIIHSEFDEVVAEAYDEVNEYQIYHPYTEKELAEREIDEYRGYLRSTDYMAIKCGELGLSMSTEYPEEHKKRSEAREKINQLQQLYGLTE